MYDAPLFRSEVYPSDPRLRFVDAERVVLSKFSFHFLLRCVRYSALPSRERLSREETFDFRRQECLMHSSPFLPPLRGRDPSFFLFPVKDKEVKERTVRQLTGLPSPPRRRFLPDGSVFPFRRCVPCSSF